MNYWREFLISLITRPARFAAAIVVLAVFVPPFRHLVTTMMADAINELGFYVVIGLVIFVGIRKILGGHRRSGH
jgi:hypothetical protein